MLATFYDCYQVLSKVYSEGAYISIALNNTPVQPLKRREITKLCYGVLDRDIELSYYIDRLTVKQPKLPIRILIKLAIYSILHLDKQPHAVINSIVELTKKLGKTGASGFVNAILRNFSKQKIPMPTDEIEFLSVKYSYPIFAVKLLIDEYKIDLAKEIIAYDKEHNYVRFDPSFNGENYLIEKGYSFKKTPFSNLFDVEKLKVNSDFEEGVFTFQSIGSVAICDAIIHKNSFLDCCSAPGGKAVLASDFVKEVVATDIHLHRVALIESYARRMKKTNIKAFCLDATVYNSEFFGRFDSVLCDVPCSGFGTVKSNPDIKINKDLNKIYELSKIQGKIIENCANYVNLGGYLIYSTCSVFSLENDDVISDFLANHDNFICDEIHSKLEEVKTKFGIQFLPNLSLGAGFYVSRLKRIK